MKNKKRPTTQRTFIREEEQEHVPHAHPHKVWRSYSEECEIRQRRQVEIALASRNYNLLKAISYRY